MFISCAQSCPKTFSPSSFLLSLSSSSFLSFAVSDFLRSLLKPKSCFFFFLQHTNFAHKVCFFASLHSISPHLYTLCTHSNLLTDVIESFFNSFSFSCSGLCCLCFKRQRRRQQKQQKTEKRQLLGTTTATKRPKNVPERSLPNDRDFVTSTP